MLAHLDAVTSLSIDAAGFALVSGSHDCSVRFWDLLGTRECIQELTAAREKGREGVLDLEFHPTMPVLASAGADGLVKHTYYVSSAQQRKKRVEEIWQRKRELGKRHLRPRLARELHRRAEAGRAAGCQGDCQGVAGD